MIRITFLLFLIFFSIKSQGQGIESTTKLGSMPIKSFDNMVLYALPQTTLGIKVTINENQTIAGPFAAFSTEFLGISGVPTQNSKKYSIDSIAIMPFSEVDPQQYYMIKTSKHFSTSKFLSLNDAGIITNPSVIVNQTIKKQTQNNENASEINFKELSIYSFFNETADTFYKTILKDSIFIRIPVIKQRSEAKTLHDKAKEAADIITSIRHRKFEILMSEEEALPEVNVLKFALTELEKIENEYLALFIGKTFKSSRNYWFYYTPTIEEEKREIFKFSETSGITDNLAETSSIVTILIKKEGITQALKNNFNSIENSGNNQILYRVPDNGQIKILRNNEIMLSQKLPIYQYGVVVPTAVSW